jgi:hypothetical protein
MGNNLTDDERQALLRTGLRLCAVWGLSDDYSARLLGADHDDHAQRVYALIGIHGALKLIFAGDTDRVRGWISADNTSTATGGMSAIQAMLSGGLPAIVRIRKYLEAEVAG